MTDDYQGGMKRSAAESGFEEGDGTIKRFRQGEGPHVEVRLLIHSKNAGAVIGKSGSNIKRLRASYNASITLPDSSGPERVMSVHAPLGSVLSCLTEAVPLFEDYQKFGPDEDFECDLRLLVHQSQAGCVIGTKGLKIRELRDKTGANIKVYTECCPNSTDRVIQIQGPVSRVISGISEIYNLLQTAPPKGAVNNYDPASLSQGSGEFDNLRGGGQTGFRGSGDRSSRGGGSGRGGFDGNRSGFDGSRGRGRGGGFGGSQGGFDSVNSGSFGGGRGFGGPPSLVGDPGPSSTTKVSIPKDLAGAIIGKAGSRIKQIRAESMADIRIAEAEPGSNDRVITIVGTQDQIQNAQYLLQLSVKEHQNRSKQY